MPDQEEGLTEEQDAETSEDAAAEAGAGADEGAKEPDAETSAKEAPTLQQTRDPAIAAARDHLEGVDIEQEREAVDKLSKDMAPE